MGDVGSIRGPVSLKLEADAKPTSPALCVVGGEGQESQGLLSFLCPQGGTSFLPPFVLGRFQNASWAKAQQAAQEASGACTQAVDNWLID